MPRTKFDDSFGEFTKNFRKTTEKTLWEMAELVKKEVKKNTSVVDEHTPLWLKRHNHPYAGRPPFPHKSPLVHKVSGDLTSNVKIFKGSRKDELKVGVLEVEVPYVKWVVRGSSKMIARDFLSFSLLSVKDKLKRRIIKDLKNQMRKQGK
jgi:hypothetical protein